ncbi:nicotinate-nucleotide--dimethylbenzimidazole phosphoribosyltransferase [Cocleimonas flava]|uniref:Nicotinate-nucleotide--dimethylbenzimidazole phosphoribosyltransferase n=1 Tax=Cocleimonas flava TaxID=634765 RepID=A0A4R1F7H9_9GAMM|nr:nicotinate-nucleotide--dimethylbenzimidazole phosphoribosyltransferase [Cocleimonas flava]TCJ88569.1 nicotinate-nucleotide-dimethylbenzimidazole phosphoribosyltransferase [Cocleimonas flava]
MNWITTPCLNRDSQYKEYAIERQSQLTKPPGSLGELENIAIRLADLQQTKIPSASDISIAVFAADHGIAKEGVSAFPQEVTAQMVMNFLSGGAAISVLAKQLNANLEIVDVGILTPLPEQSGLIIERAGAGTENAINGPAMTEDQLEIALTAGHHVIERATERDAKIFIGGEMGIANTTSASALYCALLGLTPEETTGAGTGLDDAGIQHKTKVVEQIIKTHHKWGGDTKALLQHMGGFEIAALTGAYIHAAQNGLAIIVDGFISSVAALCSVKINPSVNDYLFFSHLSAEHGHQIVLESLKQKPLLDLGMRLGEGSGAAVAANLLISACTLHNQMATFAEAAVATQI